MTAASRLTRTPSETRRLGERIGKMLRAGDVVLLSGDLGAGKTVLAQGIGRGLGVTDPIKSSSFVIMNEYDGRELRLFHADLYRLEDPQQVAELALDELASHGVLVIEWPERAESELPPEHLRLRLAYDGARGRSIEIEARGERYEGMAVRLAERKGPDLSMKLPNVAGYEFRLASIPDGTAIARLIAECDRVDGTMEYEEPTPSSDLMHHLWNLPHPDAIVGTRAGELVACGALHRQHPDRRLLKAHCDPSHRGTLLEPLLRALDASARRIGNGWPPARWLRIERVLGVGAHSLPVETSEIYERVGFGFYYVELELEASLGVRDPLVTPVGIELTSWANVDQVAFRHVYNDAFRDRGFAGYDAEGWFNEFLDDSYDVGWSFVAMAESDVVGFALCEAETTQVIWIDTLGVRPAYRRRGIAAALVTRAMTLMRDAGFERVALRVNEDNEPAQRLYKKLGFETVKKHVVYRKRL